MRNFITHYAALRIMKEPNVPDTLYKVVAYITREHGGKMELLVFRHKDYPEAGLQVPAGTVGDGEPLEAALAREVFEETGLARLQVAGKLGVFHYSHPLTGRLHVRNVFHLRAAPDTPDTWDWTETSGGEVSEEEGYVFCFYWADLDGEIELAGNQGDYLRYLLPSWSLGVRGKGQIAYPSPLTPPSLAPTGFTYRRPVRLLRPWQP